jgi:hypothetical protein
MSKLQGYSAIEVESTLNLAMKGNNRSGIAVEDHQRFYMNSSERFFRACKSKRDTHDDSNVNYLYKTLVRQPPLQIMFIKI